MKTLPRRSPLIAGLALIAAGLACVAGAPGSAPTPAASFPTVTPGGRVSISLLTPTLIPAAVDALGTPIGPVATATAEAATAIALTGTAAVPTATLPGIFTDPAVCPAAGTPTLPTQAPPFTRYAETIGRYLSSGGAATILEARLREWGALAEYGGLVRADRDFTGDGVPEVLLVVLDPQRAEFPYPGDLLIFGCDNGAYRLLYQAGYAPNRSAPILYAAEDVNGNYLNNLIYAVQTCDGQLCLTGVEIVEWNLALLSFESLLAEPVSEPAAEVEVVDLDGDGRREVVVTSGTIASPAAGPQRVVTSTLRWEDDLYVVASVEPSPAEYRIHVIHEGDEALRARDYSDAISLYQRAASSRDLLSWQYPDEAAHLQAFARYRIMLAYAARGDVASAQAAHDDLLSRFTEPEGDLPEGEPPPAFAPPAPPILSLPGGTFAEMARLFWGEFALNRDVAAACQVVAGYARAAPASYEVLNSFGYANPSYLPADLCPYGP